MKLIITVVNDNDVEGLLDKLTQNGLQATKLASTGGFLKHGNSTLMIGVEKEKVDAVIDIIKEVCRKREKYLPYNMHSDINPGFNIVYSEPIIVGGATVFVLDIDKCIKV